MNRKLLDQLYSYKSSLEHQITKLDANKTGPFPDENAVHTHEVITENKNQQLNMVLKIMDLYFEPFEDGKP